MTSASGPDPLRLANCPGCGYALEGLAPAGTCPECGGPYDQSAVVLHGFGAGKHASVATGRPWVAVAVGLVYAVCAWFWFRDWIREGWSDPFALIWAVGLSASLGWALWKRWESDMPGLVQVRLGPYGALQVNNPSAGKSKTGKMTPWRDIVELSIRAARDDTVRIRMIGPTTFWRGKQVPVDAEVRCTREQAKALAELIDGWRAAESPGKPAVQLESGRR